MRILLSCLQDLRRHQIPAYRFWADYFRNGIFEAGHTVAEIPTIDWAAGISRLSPAQQAEWRTETWERTLEFLAREQREGRPIDLFLSYLYPLQIEPAAIIEIRRRGVPCVNFFCDNVREFTRVPTEYQPFDLHWVPEFEALPMYRAAGLKHVHAPMPVWIAPKDRFAAADEREEVVFIGSEDVLRRKLLGEAIRLGAPLTIRGPGWADGGVMDVPTVGARPLSNTLRNQADFIRKRGIVEWLRKTARGLRQPSRAEIADEHLARPVFGEEYARETKKSQIIIGINRVPTFKRPINNPLKYSRLRDIEAPMMGACYLTEWTEGLGHLYELGTEIETYRTAEEMVGKIGELRADRHRRHRLRRLGQQRALTDLTVAKSIEKVCSALKYRS